MVRFRLLGDVQYVAVQSGWGVDAQGMTARIDPARGTETLVPQGGVIWVFALRRRPQRQRRRRRPLAAAA